MNNNDFDQFAEDYRFIHTKNIQGISGTDSDYFSKYKIEEVKKYFEGKAILDMGCGDGNSAKYINELCNVQSYAGIDISEKSIEEASKKDIQNFTSEVFDGVTIPYADGSFDVVFMSCVIHHIDVSQREHILKECRRVLKVGGHIIIFEHNPYNPLTLKMVKECPFDEGVVLIKSCDLRKMLIRAGFDTKIKISYTIFMPRKRLFNKMIWLEKYLKWCKIGGQYYCMAIID